MGALGALVLAAVDIFGIPWSAHLSTVSTDDTYVNRHATFVAPRVAGQISRVLVDDNTRVHKGELLAELDVVALAERYEAETTVLDWRPGACGSLRRREAAARGFKTLLPQGAEGG